MKERSVAGRPMRCKTSREILFLALTPTTEPREPLPLQAAHFRPWLTGLPQACGPLTVCLPVLLRIKPPLMRLGWCVRLPKPAAPMRHFTPGFMC